MKKKIVVIGSGFAGLTAATHLSAAGHEVHLLEKNDQSGGRASVWEKDGFTFDMGPSFYWMPEVFEQHFQHFGYKASDFYQLKRLDPGYRIYANNHQQIDASADLETLKAAFEQREKGSAKKLEAFLKDAEYKYHTAMGDYVNRLSDSITEFLEPRLIFKTIQLNLFSSIRSAIRKQFKDPVLVSMLEFPVLFLGSTPDKTPALYSMMNYADLIKGTWYPIGGMGMVSKAFTDLAKLKGVNLHLNTEVLNIEVLNKMAKRVKTNQGDFDADIVISGADYHHTEQNLLNANNRVYDQNYWEKRSMSPSALLFYVGLNKRIEGIEHHSLFFDEDFEQHAIEIYKDPKWPSKPLFYLSAASKTDNSIAPEGCENLVFLIPLAPGLTDSDDMREHYFNVQMDRLEQRTGQSLRANVVVKRSYAMRDFERDYYSFKGNAYGLANTLLQTAFLKPKIKSKKVNNLFYTGQLTVPGPGVPPTILSGEIVAKEVLKQIQAKKI